VNLGGKNKKVSDELNDELDDEFSLAGPQEFKKRRREIVIVLLVSFLFVLLTWFEIRLFATSQQLPFVHSIFFFGLVNFNIILLLLLLFMIFRNVVKVFVERRGKFFGSSLKAKLVAAFVGFSFVPTVLMFIISVFYINSSFDKWFSAKMAGVLKSSIEVTNAYYFNAKKKNYHFAHQIADAVRPINNRNKIQDKIEALRQEFSLDAVEYYPSLFGKRIVVTAADDNVPKVPAVTLEFLQKGIKVQADASIIHQFGDGNLVRVIVPVKEGRDQGAIVVSSFLPLSLVSKMDDISTAYDEFRDINPLEYPLKSIYLIILVLMTFVILLAATWFGFYLARQLSIPIVRLGRATRQVANGDYTTLDLKSGSDEINDLIASFNQMTVILEKTLKELDQHARYTDTVLKNVNTGVISIDQLGKVTTVNRHAAQLLRIDPDKYIGRSVRELLTLEYFRTFAGFLKTMQDHKVESIQKELSINVHGEAIPLLMNLSVLKDEKGAEVGKVLVFDDMTPIVSAQRAAAWTEVARRIAHEIKNPLTPIRLSAERLQRKFGAAITDPAFNDCTSMIVKQVDGLKNLVNEFSNFARLPQARPVVANLNLVVEESLSLYRQAHTQINMVFNQDSNLPEFKFDPDQIQRVLVNLIDNAISAVAKEPSPLIQISTEYDHVLKTVRLIIRDNGEGIPAVNRNRIFEPYFSTKETGTGLGLAIVKRIIEDHNGFIRATANEPKGLKLLIELPVNEVGAWKPSK
jgi:two-component system nitrogen regulation sensor histidine kinase NtrY